MTFTRRAALIIVSGAGVLAQVIVTPLLALNWAHVYFLLFGAEPRPAAEYVLRFQLIAGIAIGLSVALIVVAAVARMRGLLIAHSVLLLVIIAASAFFAVPRIDLSHPQQSHPLPSGYDPCYSGSDRCN